MHKKATILFGSLILLIGAVNPVPNAIRQRFSLILKDPSSAQIQITRRIVGKICGRYNAKNSYGGYVGFKQFVFLTGPGILYNVGTEVRSDGAVLDIDAVIKDGMSMEELISASTVGHDLMDRVKVAFRGCE
jgi:hypothetical protein